MTVYMNELGEFLPPESFDPEANRSKVYASLSKIDPKKAIGTRPWMPPKRFKEPAIGFCEECGAPFEKKRHNQIFCSRSCQRRNYNEARRLQSKFRREAGL